MNQQERDERIAHADIGTGWLPIIKDLDYRLSAIDPDYSIDQIKEKFGGLRFYFTSEKHFEELYDLVAEAEKLCWETCEGCGAVGIVQTSKYWHKTLCEPCTANKGS